MEAAVRPGPLLIAATLATAARLQLYAANEGQGEFLRVGVDRLGVAILVLEVAIVFLRFFTAIWLFRRARGLLPAAAGAPAAALFVGCGLLVALAFALAPRLLPPPLVELLAAPASNPAIAYIVQRPFEPLPVAVEYGLLFALQRAALSREATAHVLSASVVALVVSLYQQPPHARSTSSMP